MKRRIHDIRWVLFLMAFFLIMMLVMRKTAAEVGRLSDGQGIIDLTFGITPDRIGEAISNYSHMGAAFYRFVFLWVDFIYAMAYCTFYRSAIGYVCDEVGVDITTDKLLTAFPLIGMGADIMENNILFLILSPSSESTALYGLFTFFNIIKFVFVYLSLAITVGGMLCLAKKRLSS